MKPKFAATFLAVAALLMAQDNSAPSMVPAPEKPIDIKIPDSQLKEWFRINAEHEAHVRQLFQSLTTQQKQLQDAIQADETKLAAIHKDLVDLCQKRGATLNENGVDPNCIVTPKPKEEPTK